MIGILHGYLLEGSGSNLWTRSVVRCLCQQGKTVHLICQETHPQHYDFVSEAFRYNAGTVQRTFRQTVPFEGRCILHKPILGDTLPVYVWDHYDEFSRVVPMIDLSTLEIEDYLYRNVQAVEQIIHTHGLKVLHANHAVLMSVVAQRVAAATGTPFAVMPHGSAIEYAVKRDERFMEMSREALRAADRIFLIGDEMRERVNAVYGALPEIGEKLRQLHLGVDTALFTPIPRQQREQNIAALLEQVAEVPRGKAPAQSETLLNCLTADLKLEELMKAIRTSSEYKAKQPDTDLERKLRSIQWSTEKVLLFVGRIIRSKGIQSLLGALPLVLEKVPSARLVVVGHGPLREAMEVLLWALAEGNAGLVSRIVAWGEVLEGGEGGRFEELSAFFQQLRDRGQLESYFVAASRHLTPDRVIFTGYLTHKELRYLFPCCDVAVFPSAVVEAGPLVFLESLSSSCFPAGTYFGGMKVSIDRVEQHISPAGAEYMKLSPRPDQTVADIAAKIPGALDVAERYRDPLRKIALADYDWKSVSLRLADELLGMKPRRP